VAAAEDVEGQVAVAIVIAVKKPSLLMAVQRVISGIEIEDDLRRRLAVRFEEEIDKEAFDRCPGSSRLSVDLPASGAQSERRAASLPASAAITGSWRSSSWSTRSS